MIFEVNFYSTIIIEKLNRKTHLTPYLCIILYNLYRGSLVVSHLRLIAKVQLGRRNRYLKKLDQCQGHNKKHRHGYHTLKYIGV